jgi:hypothetical protein
MVKKTMFIMVILNIRMALLIEELTLYIVEQQKEIEKLKNKNKNE